MKKTMTKKAMIQEIQRLEAAAFLECKRMQKEYGKESDLHKSARTSFCAINQMMKAVGITADYQLPDSKEAFKILCELA